MKQVAVAFRICAEDYDDNFPMSIYPMDSRKETILMNTRIFCRLCRGWLPVAIAAAFFLAPVTVSAGKPPPPPPPPLPEVTFTAVNIGSGGRVAAINATGTIIGTANLPNVGSTAFVLEPEDVNGDGKPEWFKDDGKGGNALLKPLPGIADMGHGETLGTTGACDINASGQIVGWHSYTALNDWNDGPWQYEAAILWTKNGGTYTPTLLARWGRAIGINNAGNVVGYVNHALLYDPTDPDDWEDVANVPFIIVPERDTAGIVCWFKDEHGAPNGDGPDGITDLMVELAVRVDLGYDGVSYPWPGSEATHVTADLRVFSGGGIVYPDFTDLDGDGNPWFADADSDGVNDLLKPFPAGSFATTPSPNGQLAAGGIDTAAALFDITTSPPELCTNLGKLSSDEVRTTALGVNDAAWVVGESYKHIKKGWSYSHYYTGLFWKGGKMSVFSTLLSNTAVSAPLPKVINASGIVAGTATAGGSPTMFVAFPSPPLSP